MALQPRRIFIDVQSRQFVSSPSSSLPSASPAYVDEDVESVELYALRPSTDPSAPYSFVDLSSATVKFAVGSTTPAALQTSWTPIATTVTATVSEVQNGNTTGPVDEIQRIAFSGAIAAVGSYAIRFAPRTIACTIAGKVVSATNHGLYDGQVVRFSAPSGTGAPLLTQDYQVINAGRDSFQIADIGSTVPELEDVSSATVDCNIGAIITPAIAYNATIADVQNAVAAAGFVVNNIPQIIVSGESGKQINLYFGGRSGGRTYATVSVINSTLAGFSGVTANVSYNTTEIASLISAGTTTVTMEVEISEGAVRQTFRQPATLSADLISSTSPSPLPANVATSFDLQSADGSVFTVSVTNTGELMIAEQP